MTSLIRPPETHQDRVARLKTAVLMVHGRAILGELPESLFVVAAECLKGENKDFRAGVECLLINLAGAVVNEGLVIGDDYF